MKKSVYSFRNTWLAYYLAYRERGINPKQAMLWAKHCARYGVHKEGHTQKSTKKLDVLPCLNSSYDGEQITQLSGGYSIKVEFSQDSDMGPPWKEYDGCGIVSDWEPNRREEEYWENWRMDPPNERGYYYYEFKETLPKAIKEGWNAPPYYAGDKLARAWRGMRADYEFLRRYMCQDWWYSTLIVTLYKDDEEIDSESLGGMDSDSIDHFAETARDYAASMIRKARDNERAEREAANDQSEREHAQAIHINRTVAALADIRKAMEASKEFCDALDMFEHLADASELIAGVRV